MTIEPDDDLPRGAIGLPLAEQQEVEQERPTKPIDPPTARNKVGYACMEIFTQDFGAPQRSQDFKGYRVGYLYLLSVKMAGSHVVSLEHLVHSRKFTQGEWDRMVAEATKVTAEVFVPKTRQDMAKRKEGVKDIDHTNGHYHQIHSSALVGVLCDKFNFRPFKYIHGTTELPATVSAKK